MKSNFKVRASTKKSVKSAIAPHKGFAKKQVAGVVDSDIAFKTKKK